MNNFEDFSVNMKINITVLMKYECFEAGAASRQAEIDELQNNLEFSENCVIDARHERDELQKRIDSIREIMSAGVYHIPTLIRELNNALKGESNE